MKDFICIEDLPDFKKSVSEAIDLKNDPLKFNFLGRNKSLAMLFFNPSLRTRLSTQKAAQNLGLKKTSKKSPKKKASKQASTKTFRKCSRI